MPLPDIKANAGDLFKRQIIDALEYLDGEAIGLGTSKQDADATLTALAGLDTSTGLVAQTGTDTFAKRTIVSADASVTITNPGGVAGNIDLSVPAAGSDLLGTITTTSGSSQSLTSLDLTPYKFLRLVFASVSGNTAGWAISVDGVQVTPTYAAGNNIRGWMDINLAEGTFFCSSAVAIVNASGVATTYVGDNNITNASTTVTATIAPGAFDLGAIAAYGIR